MVSYLFFTWDIVACYSKIFLLTTFLKVENRSVGSGSRMSI